MNINKLQSKYEFFLHTVNSNRNRNIVIVQYESNRIEMYDTHNEPKLISQGGYGCIYHPSFPVKTKKLNIKSSKSKWK